MDKFKTMMTMVRRAERDREVELRLYCEHLPLDCEGCIVNSDGRMVCEECCDHTSGFTSFINDDIKEVCLLCCDHRRCEKDGYGNRYCAECFEMLPQVYHYGPRMKTNRRTKKKTKK